MTIFIHSNSFLIAHHKVNTTKTNSGVVNLENHQWMPKLNPN